MIEKIEDISQFDSWQGRDIFSVRILSLLYAYGCKYQFATFYRQIIDGKITAIISKLDNDVTISVADDFDNEELVHFLCVCGYSSVLCCDRFILGSRYEEGMVMSCSSKREITMLNTQLDEYPKLMDLLNFIDYGAQDFKAWYVDISHRVRHKSAKAYTLNINDEIISSGILSSMIDGYSILTAVRTKDEFMGMGYGTCLVCSICNDVKGTVYIMRDMDINESFYIKCGFENIYKWRMYK